MSALPALPAISAIKPFFGMIRNSILFIAGLAIGLLMAYWWYDSKIDKYERDIAASESLVDNIRQSSKAAAEDAKREISMLNSSLSTAMEKYKLLLKNKPTTITKEVVREIQVPGDTITIVETEIIEVCRAFPPEFRQVVNEQIDLVNKAIGFHGVER